MADAPDRDLCAGRAATGAGKRSRLAGFVAGERPGLFATSLLLLVVTGAAWLLLAREPMQQVLRLILRHPSSDLRCLTGAFFGLLLLMWPLDALLLYLLGRAWGLTAPRGRLFLGIGKARVVQACSILAWALLATVPATLGSPRLAAASCPLWFFSIGSTLWATYPPAIRGAYGARARSQFLTFLTVVFEVLLILLAAWAAHRTGLWPGV